MYIVSGGCSSGSLGNSSNCDGRIKFCFFVKANELLCSLDCTAQTFDWIWVVKTITFTKQISIGGFMYSFE